MGLGAIARVFPREGHIAAVMFDNRNENKRDHRKRTGTERDKTMTIAQMSRPAVQAKPADANATNGISVAMKQSVFPTSAPQMQYQDHMPVKLGFEGSRMLLHAFMRFTGAVLILCGPGLWLLPGSNADPALLLYKLGASIFFVFCGMALILRNKTYSQPEVYFDPIRREMRILQKNERGRPETVLRRSYDTLGAAKIRARQLEIWDVDGSVLLNIPLADQEARLALRHQLGSLVR